MADSSPNGEEAQSIMRDLRSRIGGTFSPVNEVQGSGATERLQQNRGDATAKHVKANTQQRRKIRPDAETGTAVVGGRSGWWIGFSGIGEGLKRVSVLLLDLISIPSEYQVVRTWRGFMKMVLGWAVLLCVGLFGVAACVFLAFLMLSAMVRLIGWVACHTPLLGAALSYAEIGCHDSHANVALTVGMDRFRDFACYSAPIASIMVHWFGMQCSNTSQLIDPTTAASAKRFSTIHEDLAELNDPTAALMSVPGLLFLGQNRIHEVGQQILFTDLEAKNVTSELHFNLSRQIMQAGDCVDTFVIRLVHTLGRLALNLEHVQIEQNKTRWYRPGSYREVQAAFARHLEILDTNMLQIEVHGEDCQHKLGNITHFFQAVTTQQAKNVETVKMRIQKHRTLNPWSRYKSRQEQLLQMVERTHNVAYQSALVNTRTITVRVSRLGKELREMRHSAEGRDAEYIAKEMQYRDLRNIGEHIHDMAIELDSTRTGRANVLREKFKHLEELDSGPKSI